MRALHRIFTQIAFLLTLASVSLGLAAKDITGRVVAVSDGDTLTVLDASKTQHKIRLAGIDAPERAQPFGTRSRQVLSKYVFSKDVTVLVVDVDRYKRVVGIVTLGSKDINQQLVAEGYAWAYRQFLKKLPAGKADVYLESERQAKANKAGLWSDKDASPPWEWRRKK